MIGGHFQQAPAPVENFWAAGGLEGAKRPPRMEYFAFLLPAHSAGAEKSGR